MAEPLTTFQTIRNGMLTEIGAERAYSALFADPQGYAISNIMSQGIMGIPLNDMMRTHPVIASAVQAFGTKFQQTLHGMAPGVIGDPNVMIAGAASAAGSMRGSAGGAMYGAESVNAAGLLTSQLSGQFFNADGTQKGSARGFLQHDFGQAVAQAGAAGLYKDLSPVRQSLIKDDAHLDSLIASAKASGNEAGVRYFEDIRSQAKSRGVGVGSMNASFLEANEKDLRSFSDRTQSVVDQLAEARKYFGNQSVQDLMALAESATGASFFSDYGKKQMKTVLPRLQAEAEARGVSLTGPGGLMEEISAVSRLNIQNHQMVYGGDASAIQDMDAKLRMDSNAEATVAVNEARKLGVNLNHEDVMKQANAAKMSALEGNKSAVAAISLMESGRLSEQESGYLKQALQGLGGDKDADVRSWMDKFVQTKTGTDADTWLAKRGGVAGAISKINSDSGLGLVRDVARRDQFRTAEGSSALFDAAAKGTGLTGDDLRNLYTGVNADTLNALGGAKSREDIMAALKNGGVTPEQLGGKSLESYAAQLESMNKRSRGGLAGAIAETKDVLGTQMGDIYASASGMQGHRKNIEDTQNVYKTIGLEGDDRGPVGNFISGFLDKSFKNAAAANNGDLYNKDVAASSSNANISLIAGKEEVKAADTQRRVDTQESTREMDDKLSKKSSNEPMKVIITNWPMEHPTGSL